VDVVVENAEDGVKRTTRENEEKGERTVINKKLV
jgi:hypothetical protein